MDRALTLLEKVGSNITEEPQEDGDTDSEEEVDECDDDQFDANYMEYQEKALSMSLMQSVALPEVPRSPAAGSQQSQSLSSPGKQQLKVPVSAIFTRNDDDDGIELDDDEEAKLYIAIEDP